MSQRLVIDILMNGERCANIYLRWGGYTIPAMEMVKRIIDLCSTTSEFEYELAKEFGLNPNDSVIHPEWPVCDCIGNDGMVSISEEEMNSVRDLAENTIIIDLGTQSLMHDLFFEGDMTDLGYRYPKVIGNVFCFPLWKIDKAIEMFEYIESTYDGFFVNNDKILLTIQ